jgi:aldose 1-epimerase
MASVSRQLLFAVLCVVAASVLAAGADDDAGTTTEVGVYELRMGDFCVKVTNWGARLMSVVVSDSKGRYDDLPGILHWLIPGAGLSSGPWFCREFG